MSGDSGENFSLRAFDPPSKQPWTVGRFWALERLGFVVHLVTTKKGPNPALLETDPSAGAALLGRAMKLAGIAWCDQVHGSVVLEVSSGGPAGKADALVTGAASVGLMVRAADCPLILAADPASRSIGAAHASWRGTVSRIAARMTAELGCRFGARSEDMTVCLCPSAGPCCYEVGQDVYRQAVDGIGSLAEGFFIRREGRLYFDLWAANSHQLRRAGVPEENIHLAGLCTICNNDIFPSHRAEGQGAGRGAAVIAIAP